MILGYPGALLLGLPFGVVAGCLFYIARYFRWRARQGPRPGFLVAGIALFYGGLLGAPLFPPASTGDEVCVVVLMTGAAVITLFAFVLYRSMMSPRLR